MQIAANRWLTGYARTYKPPMASPSVKSPKTVTASEYFTPYSAIIDRKNTGITRKNPSVVNPMTKLPQTTTQLHVPSGETRCEEAPEWHWTFTGPSIRMQATTADRQWLIQQCHYYTREHNATQHYSLKEHNDPVVLKHYLDTPAWWLFQIQNFVLQ